MDIFLTKLSLSSIKNFFNPKPKFYEFFFQGHSLYNLENIPMEMLNYGDDATMIHLASDTFYTRDQYVRSGGFIKFIFEENSLNRIKNEINIESKYIDKGDFLLTYRDKINRVYQQTVQYYINIIVDNDICGSRYKYYIKFQNYGRTKTLGKRK